MARFVIVYQGMQDPTPVQEHALRERLQDVKVLDHTPGAMLVEGTSSRLRSLLADVPDWELATAATVRVRPPRRSRLKAAA